MTSSTSCPSITARHTASWLARKEGKPNSLCSSSSSGVLVRGSVLRIGAGAGAADPFADPREGAAAGESGGSGTGDDGPLGGRGGEGTWPTLPTTSIT